MSKKSVEVRVSKIGPGGRPQAQVFVESKISATDLSGLLHKVVTNEPILRAGGLGPCGGCKSGLDLNITELPEIFQMEV